MFEGGKGLGRFKVYLAGGMSGLSMKQQNEWRRHVKNNLTNKYTSANKVQIVNPVDYYNFEEKLYDTNREVMDFDLYKVRDSDLIIVNFNSPKSIGTMTEIAIAYEHRKPIIGLNVNDMKLHPWQNEMCNKMFNDIDKMIEYINDFYLN